MQEDSWKFVELLYKITFPRNYSGIVNSRKWVTMNKFETTLEHVMAWENGERSDFIRKETFPIRSGVSHYREKIRNLLEIDLSWFITIVRDCVHRRLNLLLRFWIARLSANIIYVGLLSSSEEIKRKITTYRWLSWIDSIGTQRFVNV